MQAEEKDGRIGVEEELIKFRPSPNFKNMKKFLKHRSDYTETITPVSSPVSCPEVQLQAQPQARTQSQAQVQATRSQPQTRSQTQKLEHRREELKPAVVQPPLPPYPPPPDSPTLLNIKIKQERIDDEISNNDESMDSITQSMEQAQPESNHKDERPKKTICKEFIRGNCKRPVCKFAHEVDVSQLAGVFTFCWNYQNAVCTYPNCRFVHATVFEEAEFYRTGVLPPHARSHLKKQGLPPPPPPEETQPDMPPFANPPPPLQAGVDKSLMSCILAPSIVERPIVEEFRVALPRSISPLKREKSDTDDFSSSPRDRESKEKVGKPCSRCELMEFRLVYNKQKIKDMIHSSEEISKKMAQLTKKTNKLSNVLLTLIKPSLPTSKGGASNGFVGNEKEKAVMEQLSNFASSTNSPTSMINEDSVKTIFHSNNNLTSLMAKLLYANGDQSTPPDNSRET